PPDRSRSRDRKAGAMPVRLTPHGYLLVAFLAACGGGGGCESCESCSGRARADAGPGVHLAPTSDVVVLALSAVPRPQPPKDMPMGAYMSCGVYDGPV